MFDKKKLPDGTTVEFRDDGTFKLSVTRIDEYGYETQVAVRLDLRVFPGDLAEKNKVGTDRSEPNINPYLPPPVGRISLSWNPFTMLSQLVSPEVLGKLVGIICVVGCCVLFIMMIPMIVSNAISILGLKMLGVKP